MMVPVIPGVVRSVTGIGQNDVTREYRCLIPRANTPKRSRNVRNSVDRGTVLALLGFCLIADGGALFLCGFLFGGS